MIKIAILAAVMTFDSAMSCLAQSTTDVPSWYGGGSQPVTTGCGHSNEPSCVTFMMVPGGGAGGGPLTPPPNSGDADLDKALAICREHYASHLTYGGTGIRWEPEFAASCDKVQDAYNAASLAKRNADAEKNRSERLAKSAPERAWLDHYAETLGKKP